MKTKKDIIDDISNILAENNMAIGMDGWIEYPAEDILDLICDYIQENYVRINDVKTDCL